MIGVKINLVGKKLENFDINSILIIDETEVQGKVKDSFTPFKSQLC